MHAWHTSVLTMGLVQRRLGTMGVALAGVRSHRTPLIPLEGLPSFPTSKSSSYISLVGGRKECRVDDE